MRKLLLIVFLSISVLTLKAQTNLDSLYTIWQDETQSDSTRVNAYNEYIWKGFISSQPDSAFELAEALII